MFRSIISFFEMVDVNPMWLVLIIMLSFVRCIVPYDLVSKVEEVKRDDGKKEYRIYKYK